MTFQKISHLTIGYFSLHYSYRKERFIQYVLIILDIKKVLRFSLPEDCKHYFYSFQYLLINRPMFAFPTGFIVCKCIL